MYIFLAVQELVPANVASISVLYFLSQFGVCCHVSSAVTFSVKLFPPESRGAAVGLAKGYFGLSSAVLGDFAGGYFSNYPVYFILFTALVIPLISESPAWLTHTIAVVGLPSLPPSRVRLCLRHCRFIGSKPSSQSHDPVGLR